MHSQPNSVQPSRNSNTASAHSSKRRTAIAIFILFALPPLLAFIALKTGWYEKQPLTHHGVLLTPPLNASVLLDEESQSAAQNTYSPSEKALTNSNSPQKWLLLSWIPEQCADACQSRIIQMGQMVQALGAERARVETLYVTAQENNLSDDHLNNIDSKNTPNKKVFDAMQTISWIQQHQPRAIITQVSATTIQNWLSPVEQELSSEKLATLDTTQPGLMIVDPMRQAMLYYPALTSKQQVIAQGKNIIRDLQKLLKVSRIG